MERQTTSYAVYYAEMVEEQDGLCRLGEMEFLDAGEAVSCPASECVRTPAEAVRAFTDAMMSRAWEAHELPNTARTRAWGSGPLVSVTPMGGESRVYVVWVGGFGGGTT